MKLMILHLVYVSIILMARFDDVRPNSLSKRLAAVRRWRARPRQCN